MGSNGCIDLTSDPPSLLFKQLAANGFCVIDHPANHVLLDALEVLSRWFQQPLAVKQAAATAVPADAEAAAAAAGRGFFTLPDKEVLEVKQGWRPDGIPADIRLAVSAVSKQK
jgi:hypothetical protein